MEARAGPIETSVISDSARLPFSIEAFLATTPVRQCCFGRKKYEKDYSKNSHEGLQSFESRVKWGNASILRSKQPSIVHRAFQVVRPFGGIKTCRRRFADGRNDEPIPSQTTLPF